MLPHGHERICDDFERTTGHALALWVAAEDRFGSEVVEVTIDGAHVGGFGLPGGDSADEVVAAFGPTSPGSGCVGNQR